ncbi:MAG: hypothetical protein ABJB98_05245 [Actinomycetota bacterium]
MIAGAAFCLHPPVLVPEGLSHVAQWAERFAVIGSADGSPSD